MKKLFLLYAKGVAMGAADVVPGVSGGTIAFITGIYDELLGSIAKAPEGLFLLARGRVAEAWRLVNGTFLLVLLAGIVSSILTLARLITYLLNHHSIPVWSFFFGLILVSSYLIAREIRSWHVSRIVAFAVGIALAYWITVAAPVQWSDSPLSLFCAGAIAICAMILPGISGSFILLLLGLYPLVIAAVRNLELGILAVFAAGCLSGILAFSSLLSWLLRRWRDLTLAFLTGLMLGSLNKVWPWKETLSWRVDSRGEQVPVLQQNLLPGQFSEATGLDSQLGLAVLLAVIGVLLVLGLQHFAASRESSEQTAMN